jgi:phosphoribosyl-AMP cyclohydrolase
MSSEIENGLEARLDFQKLKGIANLNLDVLPVVVQDIKTKEVLILAYANQEALAYTLTHNVAAFWSTSRNELWVKGATSGDQLTVHEIRINCEQNSLLYVVSPIKKGACHTKDEHGESRVSCYYRKMKALTELSWL